MFPVVQCIIIKSWHVLQHKLTLAVMDSNVVADNTKLPAVHITLSMWK